MGIVKKNPTPPPPPPPPPSTAPSSSNLTPISGPHDVHPLPLYTPHTPCSGCQLKSSGDMFTCRTCNFTLHRSCAEFHQACVKLPQSFTHPCHVSCPLRLTDCTYPGGRYACNACRGPGERWSYHCASCRYDLHISCATKPFKVRHQAYASCELSLTFEGQYVNPNGFTCNVCRKVGLSQWGYRCSSCDFDVHLGCVDGAPPCDAIF